MKFLAASHSGGFFFPHQASNFAGEVDWFFFALYWISMFFFVGIVVATIWFMIAFRRRAGYKGSPEALHNNALEITWTVIPTFLVVWMFSQGVVGYLDMMKAPVETEDIQVLAQQWSWQFTYPNGAVTAEELHLPLDTDVKLTMRSNDVLHSLFIPVFRVKQDVVPGRYTYMWFRPIRVNDKVSAEELAAAVKEREAKAKEKSVDVKDIPWEYERLGFTEDGTRFYHLFCTEYCGQKHSMMNVRVIVHTPEDYQAWLDKAAQPPEGDAEHGKWLYERKGCKACHSVDGSKNTGPSWLGTWGKDVPLTGGASTKFDENYVRESILDPQAKIHAGFENVRMNSYRGQLKDVEIDKIIAFMKTLTE